MLKVIEQGVISGKYMIRLTNDAWIQLRSTNPTQDQINEELLIYEQQLLDIDIKGEESDIRSNESGDGRADPGDDPSFGLPQGEIPA